MLVFQQEFGSAHVGSEHAFFNQAVGFVAHHGHDAFDFALFVENHLGFGGLKLHRAALAAFFKQDLIELVEGIDVRLERVVAAVFNPIPHLGVGEAGMGAHHGGVETVGFKIAGVGENHVAHHTQPIHIGIERANAVGEAFWQHGNHAAREIHAGGAIQRVGINRVFRLHIVAHVGNSHHQAEIATLFFGIHGIVEIARAFAVYRY